MRRSIVFAIAAVWCWMLSVATAQELFTDFSSASLQSWSVSANTIQLEGAPTWTLEPNAYRWVYFGAEGVSGQQPEFRIGSNENRFLGTLDGHRFVWSYDQRTWSFFDNNAGTNDDFRFSNDAPFIQNEVYVAYSTPYPISRTQDLVERLQSKWFVAPTTSADANLVVGATENDLPLYGFSLTNPLAQEAKTKVVLVGGNHSGETAGSFALEGMIDFLASNDARARQMRNVAEFFIYPQVDPMGRDEGFYRGNSQNAFNDHNRFWDASVSGDNGGFSEIDLLTDVMRADTQSDVDFTLDFHGFFDPGPNFIYTDSAGADTVFLQELEQLEPALELAVDDDTVPAGILEFWAKTPAGLNSDFAFTPEFSPNATLEQSMEWGLSYALAMYAQLGSPDFSRSPAEVDVLNRAINQGSSDLVLDLNRDGALNDADLDFLLQEVMGTTLGDADLNGNVGFPDFLVLSDSFGQQGGWGDGDFDGDGNVQFPDFLVLSQNFGSVGARIAKVPEPDGMPYRLACWYLLVISAGRGTVGRRRLVSSKSESAASI